MASPIPMPFGLLVDEGLEQARRNSFGNPRPGVGDGDLNAGIVDSSGCDGQFAPGRGRAHRFGCVAQQIDDHLLNLHFVGHDRRQIARELGAHLDIGRMRGRADQRAMASSATLFDVLDRALGVALLPRNRAACG